MKNDINFQKLILDPKQKQKHLQELLKLLEKVGY